MHSQFKLRGLFLFCFLLSGLLHGSGPVDIYHFETIEQKVRYKALIEKFRCPKCLNTNIAGSDAPIAQDLRRTVHRLVVQEEFSDTEVEDYLHERYGDFVLYEPPLNSSSWLIWFMPLFFLLVGLYVVYSIKADLGSRPLAALSDSDREVLKGIADKQE